jgi:NAD(P)-dependent dehydrogenase (short-subunit alcohol dehydrogenase family)
MSGDFIGKVIAITGAASGIGRRAVERFAAEGATVIALDIASLPDVAGVAARSLDVTSEDDWLSLFAWLLPLHGRIDVLVNCAGIIRMGSVADTSLVDFRAVMAVNVEGTFLGTKHAMRVMLASGEGAIVNLSSTAGIAASPGAAAYCASKGAVRMLSKVAALDAIAAGTRVRVNSLHPAMTETPMIDKIIDQLGGDATTRAAFAAIQPSGRFAQTDDIVDAIMFLASDRAGFVNGSEMLVDNGFTAQ